MEVSGQLHNTAILPPEKKPRMATESRSLGGPKI